MARLTVIIPVYNVERFLPMCLDSVRGQTLRDLEIICIDDGSTDRSPQILAMTAALDPRVVVITKPNGGVSAARNTGLRAATSPAVMFVDSDDFLHPKACEKALKALESNDADIVTFGGHVHPSALSTRWFERALSPRKITYEGFHPDLLFVEPTRPFIWHNVFSRDFLVREGLEFDESVPFGEDQLFCFAVYPVSRRTVLIPDKLYYYRVFRPQSLMDSRKSSRMEMLKEHQHMVRLVLEMWESRGWLDQYRPQVLDWVFEFLGDEAVGARGKKAPALRAGLADLLTTYFPQSPWVEGLSPAARVLLGRLTAPAGAGAAVANRAALLAWQGATHPARTAVGVVERVGRSWPALKAKGVLWRVTPVSSRTHWKRLQELNDRLEDDAQRDAALRLLHLEWVGRVAKPVDQN